MYLSIVHSHGACKEKCLGYIGIYIYMYIINTISTLCIVSKCAARPAALLSLALVICFSLYFASL